MVLIKQTKLELPYTPMSVANNYYVFDYLPTYVWKNQKQNHMKHAIACMYIAKYTC